MTGREEAVVTVSVFDLITGRILCALTVPPDQLAANVPPGCGTVPGHVDGARRRVNPETGQVEAWQPPPLDADHVWNVDLERWELPASVVARRSERGAVTLRINQLEARQPRALRELALGLPGALERLQDIDNQIAELRKALQ